MMFVMKILALFGRKAPSSAPASNALEKEDAHLADYLYPQSASELLNTPRRQKLLTHIWQRTSLPKAPFEQLYLKPIERYAELVQLLPASESHHHAYLGGMLDHGLEIMAYALKLRQSHLLPIGSTPEEQTAQSEIWTAGVAYAALLHDIGKIAVDLHVEYENGDIWQPWNGALSLPYRFKYKMNREYRLHSASTGLLYHQVLDASILNWLNETPELWSALLYVLSGQLEHAGVLGKIVTKADQASVSQELGGDINKLATAPKNALQRKLLDGLRYLVKEELKLNNAGPSDGWLTHDGLWLVSKTVSDKLRAYLLAQGIPGIPTKNSILFDVMQAHHILLPTREGKAIWSGTVTSESGWTQSLTFLKVATSTIWENLDELSLFDGSIILNEVSENKSEPSQQVAIKTNQAIQSEAEESASSPLIMSQKTSDLDALFDILGFEDITAPPQDLKPENNMQQYPIEKKVLKETCTAQNEVRIKPEKAEPKITPHRDGKHFMSWLKQGILERKLLFNDQKAMIHTVADTLYLVTPSIFMRYAHEFPDIQPLAKAEKLQDWQWVQRQFEDIKSHKKHPNGLNIWTCTVSGQYKRSKIHGYSLSKPSEILPEITFNNPYIKLDAE